MGLLSENPGRYMLAFHKISVASTPRPAMIRGAKSGFCRMFLRASRLTSLAFSEKVRAAGPTAFVTSRWTFLTRLYLWLSVY